jgi:hypothetical protein
MPFVRPRFFCARKGRAQKTNQVYLFGLFMSCRIGEKARKEISLSSPLTRVAVALFNNM